MTKPRSPGSSAICASSAGRAHVTSSASDPLLPCRPYQPGDHARWLRGRLTRSMLIASVVGGIVTAAASLGLGVVAAGADPLTTVTAWASVLLFPIAFLVIHWATIGARRWAAIELVVWAARLAASRYAAVTGINDPADRDRAASWLASAPPSGGEPGERTYWRAYVHLLLGDEAAARAELDRLAGSTELAFERATLSAQIDIAEGRPTNAAELDRLVAATPPSETRAIAAVEVAALRSQVAWTCGDDDVTPVLAALPLVDGRSGRTLLRHYWLPLAATVIAVWAGIWLLLSLLR
jgi:hypothetical protein